MGDRAGTPQHSQQTTRCTHGIILQVKKIITMKANFTVLLFMELLPWHLLYIMFLDTCLNSLLSEGKKSF